jgi:streptogramin lyase
VPALPGAEPLAKRPVQKQKATLRITIPRRKHGRRGSHRGHYVSPSTQSIAIVFTLPASHQHLIYNEDLTPATNPNCTASLVSLTICTVTLTVPAGEYGATFATYDGSLDGNGNPTGNELSANQNVPVRIAAGAPNAINVTLDGIPTSAVVLAVGGLNPGTSSGFTASKCLTSAKVEVLGVDADSNIILGPGAPVPALSSNDVTHLSISATPGPASPNTFTLTSPNLPDAKSVVQLTASVTPSDASGGAPQSAQVNLTFNSDICGVVTGTFSTGITSAPTEITEGADGNMWFTEMDDAGDRIGRITPSGVVTEFKIATPTSRPFGITKGPDGNVWFTEHIGRNIGRITPSGTISEFAVDQVGGGPNYITSGPDGNLWFTTSCEVVRMTPTGTFSQVSPSPVPGAGGVAAGSDGGVWFTSGANILGRLSPATRAVVAVSVNVALPNFTDPEGPMVSGPDGNLWFLRLQQEGSGEPEVVRMAPNFSGTATAFQTSSGIETLAAGPDGNIWVGGGALDRFTTSGIRTTFPIPSSLNDIGSIAAGPDDSLWLVDNFDVVVVRIQ